MHASNERAPNVRKVIRKSGSSRRSVCGQVERLGSRPACSLALRAGAFEGLRARIFRRQKAGWAIMQLNSQNRSRIRLHARRKELICVFAERAAPFEEHGETLSSREPEDLAHAGRHFDRPTREGDFSANRWQRGSVGTLAGMAGSEARAFNSAEDRRASSCQPAAR